MKKKVKKISLSRETIGQLKNPQLSGLVGGLVVANDMEDRRCEPSIVSCPGCTA
jgi:hypothetical protein